MIDVDTWDPHETLDGPGLWSHEQLYLPEESGGLRERMQDMAMDAAARGLRSPQVVDCLWLYAELGKSKQKARHGTRLLFKFIGG